MTTVEDLYTYMEEREAIRRKKEQGLPKPWTKNPILQKYKFTNVNRIHDRTTSELLGIYRDNVAKSTPETTLYNCALYRYFGTSEFAKAVGWMRRHDAAHIARVARLRLNGGERVFTGAYIVTNCGEYGPKEEVVGSFLGNLWETRADIVSAFCGERSWRMAYAQMVLVHGFGGKGFYAKETLLDYMLCYPGIALDEATWSPCGPGARRGLNRLYGRHLKFDQKETKFIEEMRQVQMKLAKYWPGLTMHDIQWNLCEFDKFERVRLGEGRPRSKYAGT